MTPGRRKPYHMPVLKRLIPVVCHQCRRTIGMREPEAHGEWACPKCKVTTKEPWPPAASAEGSQTDG